MVSHSIHCLPQGKKILIIKLAASGDVLRTTPILRGLKRKFPRSFITWLTEEESKGLLKENQYIDRLLAYGPNAVKLLETEQFDILICLDKEIKAIALASSIKAKRKMGFGLDEANGNLKPLNKESRYAVRLGLSDELKFKKNQKTYPEIIFEMACLDYRRDEYVLNIPQQDKNYAYDCLRKAGVSPEGRRVGLNTGAGVRFANKVWEEEGFAELINLLRGGTDAEILLLGGPQESERNVRIASMAKGERLYNMGTGHSLGEFAAIIDYCSLIFSGDTTAMHISIALQKPTVAMFGSTCAQEIELYGRGVKLFADIDCRPCYKNSCSKEINCMNLIKPSEAFRAIKKLLS
jgi:heptosyltransferase-2